MIYFYPKDFTFVCPTEIAEFARLTKEFADRGGGHRGGGGAAGRRCAYARVSLAAKQPRLA